MTASRTMDIRGANRGGKAATRALLACGDLPGLAIQIVDCTAERADRLAAPWAEAGHRAIAITGDARTVPIRSDLDVLALLTDDPSVQWRMLERNRAKLVVGGILIASAEAGPAGGRVLGFGAVVPEHDHAARQQANRLFACIVALTDGERTHSREVSAPTWNTVQMEAVRDVLYRRLAADTRCFLDRGEVKGGIYVATAWPTAAVHAVELQDRQGRSRSQMRVEANRIAATAGEKRAVVYFDAANPRWVYAVIPNRRRQTVSVELPEPGAASAFRTVRANERLKRDQIHRMAQEQAAREQMQPERRATTTTSSVYATD